MPVYGQSYWAPAKTRAAARSKSATGTLTADVVVIGGGFTGGAAAYALAHAGLDVVLLEAECLATGATAGSIGAVLPVPDAALIDVEKDAGKRPARVVFAELRKSALDLAATLKRLGVKCDLAATSLLVNAPFTNDAACLKKELAARKALKLDGLWLSPEASRRELATETQGAMRVRDAAVLHPVRAALGLAEAARAKGARIFEQTRVKKTTFTRKDATVVFTGGSITTRGVVVATGTPGPVFHQLDRHVRTARGYAVVTEPLTPAMRKLVGARRALYTEGTESPRFLRWLPGNRALFAGLTGPDIDGPLRAAAVRQRANQLMYELSTIYPAISGLRPEWAWDFTHYETVDGLPVIGPHRNFPRHYFALGRARHGVSFAWLASRVLLRQYQGEPAKGDDLLGFARIL